LAVGTSSSADWKELNGIGWSPYALPMGIDFLTSFGTLTLATNGGSVAAVIELASPMLLQSVAIYNTNTTLERTWGWDLYVQNTNTGDSAENTLTRVAASSADETYTAAAASIRTINASSAPVYLRPGTYWIVIQCRHASNSFGMGAQVTDSAFASGLNYIQTKTTSNPNGATLDFVAATWTKDDARVGVILRGRVFGQTSAF
jgi:hypothetical protein